MVTADFHFACLVSFLFFCWFLWACFSTAVNGDETYALFFPGFIGGGGPLLSLFFSLLGLVWPVKMGGRVAVRGKSRGRAREEGG